MKYSALWNYAAVLFVVMCLHSSGQSHSNRIAPKSRAGTGNHPNTLYIDCSASINGDGSIRRPWNSLDTASRQPLLPGNHLLIKRGSICHGMLTPRGTGSLSLPILLGAYGTGPVPRIDGGGKVSAAVLLSDISHVVIEDLELTNKGDTSSPHRGLYVTSQRAESADIHVSDLYIHDVQGPVGYADADKSGGGIILQVLAGLPARFDNVVIEHNRIEDVARSGIFVFGTTNNQRPRANRAWPDGSTRIVIRGNTLAQLAGDGIVADGTAGALIEQNVVTGGNLSGRDFLFPKTRNCSAGIWTFNANGTLIQKNEVSGYVFGQSSINGCDGTAFDVDYDQDGTIVQYNYSHDNEGGFTLLCSDDQARTADVRYNLSIDDGHIFSVSPCKFPTIGTFDGLRIYNNTFVSSNPGTSLEFIPLPVLYRPGTFLFVNNILYATSRSKSVIACGNDCSNNLFYRASPAGTRYITGDPLFVDAMKRGPGRLAAGQGFRLVQGSPAIHAGIRVSGGAGTDYFGNPISADADPNIGIDNGSGWQNNY